MYFLMPFNFQVLVPNIPMIGSLQTSELKTKKKKGDKFSQRQVEHLSTQESTLLGIYKHSLITVETPSKKQKIAILIVL